MLDWIFRKNTAPAGDAKPARPSDAAKGAGAAKPAAPAAPAAPAVDWAQRLQAAQGDDAALVALARESAPVDVRLAAVGAIVGEAGLKQAERELRDRDRRVHRLAKQRLHALLARRETAAQASLLIESARTLLTAPLIPANRLVELDRAWRAMDAQLIDAAQAATFEGLLGQLASLTRERGDLILKVDRWNADARTALAALQSACRAAAEGAQTRGDLAAAMAAARAVHETAPSDDGVAASLQPLQEALQTAAQLDERLAVLEEVMHAPPPAPAAKAVEATEAPAGAPEAAEMATAEAALVEAAATSEVVASEPVAGEAVASEPVATEPLAAELVASDPVAAEAVAVEAVAPPVALEPVASDVV
ncbi:MAG TPA: hypothetical protein VFZ93_09270, partial [Albitalea sp.]